MERAYAQKENGRSVIALSYLSALSDYPDSIFNYESNEANINKIVRESYKTLNIRQAFLPFYQVQAAERAQSSRKLAQKMLKDFTSVYKNSFNEASTI